MKLLIYSHFFAPSVGGVETIALSLARGLADLRDSNGAPQFEIILVTQTPVGNYDDRALPFRAVRRPGLVQLWQLIRAADVVHIAGPALAPLLVARLARTPVVVEHHGYQAICPNGILLHQPERSVCPGHFQSGHYGECLRCVARESSWHRSWARLLLMFPRHWLSRRATLNVGVTQHALARLSLPHSSLVYHGTEDPFGPASKSPSPHSPVENVGKTCFAYLGRFVPEKGIRLLLEATRLLIDEGHEFEVRLIGDGPERASIEGTIARDRLQACVFITGFLTGERLAKELSEVAVVVMPSLWEETAGLSAIEQMMRGKLVIASAIGGLGEIVGDAGLTFPPGNAGALAQCMRKVLRDSLIINSLGQKARDAALRFFRREGMIKDHARLYLKAASSASRGRRSA